MSGQLLDRRAAGRKRQIGERMQVTHPRPGRAMRPRADRAPVLGNLAGHVCLVDGNRRYAEVARRSQAPRTEAEG